MKILAKTKSEVIELLKQKGALSVDEVSQVLGISKTNSRQHLLSLQKQDLVKSHFRNQGGQGRPQLVFSLHEESASKLFPSAEPKLLRGLLEHLMESGQQGLVKEFFEQFWEQRLVEFNLRLKREGKEDYATRLKVLRSLLEDEGFMPKTVRKASGDVLKECNCPFRETVKVTGLPCGLELKFIQTALGSKVSRLSYIPAGEPTCDYEVKKR